jgi:hypothetical protein
MLTAFQLDCLHLSALLAVLNCCAVWVFRSPFSVQGTPLQPYPHPILLATQRTFESKQHPCSPPPFRLPVYPLYSHITELGHHAHIRALHGYLR